MNFLFSPRAILQVLYFIVASSAFTSHKLLPSAQLFPWNEPKPILNLDRCFLPLLPRQNQLCLLFLNNFLQVNIHPLPYQPVILHKPIPTVVALSFFPSTLQDNLALVHLIEGRWDNLTGKYEYFQLLANFPPVAQTKPWNCLVTVDLYPPRTPSQAQLSEWYYDPLRPRTFVEGLPYDSSRLTLNLHAENFYGGLIKHVFVVQKEVIEAPSQLRMLKTVLEQASKAPLFSGLKQYQKSVVIILLEATENEVVSRGKVDICLQCRDFIRLEKFSEWPASELVGTPTERPFWLVRSFNDGVRDLLIFCETHLEQGSHRDLARMIRRAPSPNEQLLHAALHIWSHFMKNDSYQVESRWGDPTPIPKICGAGRNFEYEKLQSQLALEDGHAAPLLRIELDDAPRPHYLPYYLDNIFNASQFISCGGQEEYTLTAFGELINSYDKPSWILILLSGAGFITLLRIPGERYSWANFGSNAFAFLKIFLEQSDPISERFLRKGSQRIFAATFLLAGILFSNGYKNQNVYNMVLPRKPIFYETLDELLRDNFTVYVPSRTVSFGRYFEETEYNAPQIARPYVPFYSRKHVRSFQSEGIRFTSASGFLRDSLRTTLNYYEEGELRIQDALINNSDLIGMEVAKKLAFQVVKELGVGRPAEEDFYRREKAELFRILCECRRTALVLSSEQYLEYAGRLRGRRVSVGREDYRVNEQSIGFHFQGFIPNQVLRRVGQLKQSGLGERWTRLLWEMSRQSKGVVGREGPEGAKLDGNIVVVFVVLGCGLLVTFFGFFLEIF